MEFYRDSLQEAEASIYPDVRQKYFRKAQENIIKMSKNEIKFQQKCKVLKFQLDEMRRGGDAALRDFKIDGSDDDEKKRRKSILPSFKTTFSKKDVPVEEDEVVSLPDDITITVTEEEVIEVSKKPASIPLSAVASTFSPGNMTP